MKRIFSVLLVLAFWVVTSVSVFAYTYTKVDLKDLTDTQTNDQPSSWAKDGVSQASELEILPEYLNNGYTQPITRAEFCALAVVTYEHIKGTEISARKSFKDTRDVNVQKMGALGVVGGVGNDNFAPDDLLTREQAAVILVNLANSLGKSLTVKPTTFSDKSLISSWALTPVGQVQASGIMSGTGNNFSPKGSYTREQSILTLIRIYDICK